MTLPVNLAAMPNVGNGYGLVRVINLVENAVIAEANSPALAFGQFLASHRTRILT